MNTKATSCPARPAGPPVPAAGGRRPRHRPVGAPDKALAKVEMDRYATADELAEDRLLLQSDAEECVPQGPVVAARAPVG